MGLPFVVTRLTNRVEVFTVDRHQSIAYRMLDRMLQGWQVIIRIIDAPLLGWLGWSLLEAKTKGEEKSVN